MNPTPQEILGHLPGGRVLDVATGSGGFIQFLLTGLPAYAEIIGIDSNERAAAAFEASFKGQTNVHFKLMDAASLEFDSASFDLVCISNSLHHFADPQPVLRQMERVLRPGGALLIAEMYRDGQTETQLTHVLLHHWWAAVDTVSGITHRETYQRHELVEMASSLGLQAPRLYDLSDTESDPHNPEIVQELEPVFERYIQRADGHPQLQAQGEQLRQRVQQVGFHSATTLVALSQKKG